LKYISYTMKSKNLFKIYIKILPLICLLGTLFYADLNAKTESTFLIGIQFRDYPYIVSAQPLHPKEQKILQEAFILGSKSTTNLWVNLQYNSPQRFVLSPELRGTDLSQALLEFDIKLKESAQKIIQEELEITNDTKLRIQIQPTTVWIYKDKNKAIIKDIFLRVLVEDDFLSSSEKQILKERLEHNVNQGHNFKKLKILIAAIILGNFYNESIPSFSIKTEYHPYSPILLKYLEYIEEQPMGGILINFSKLKQIPLISLKKITTHLYRIRNVIIPKKTRNNSIEYLSAFPQEGILYYLLSSRISIKSRLSLQIALQKIEKAMKQNGLPAPQDINAFSIPQKLILLTDIAIKYNLPIDKGIIATAVDAWDNHLSLEERKKILPRLTNTRVVIAPESLVTPKKTKANIPQRRITRRNFLKQLSLIPLFSAFIPIPSLTNAQPVPSGVQPKIDFFSLPLSEQKKLINKVLSNQLPQEIKDAIEKQIAQTIVDISYRALRKETTEEDLNKLNLLLKTKALGLPSNNADDVISLLYTAMKSKKLQESLFQYLSSVLNSADQFTHSLKSICLFILCEPRWFSPEWIAKAGGIFEQKIIPQGIPSPYLCDLGMGIIDASNNMHDNYKDWPKKISQYLRSLPDTAIYTAFSQVYRFETYTCVYNAIRKELIKRIKTKYNHNFFKFIAQNNPFKNSNDFVNTMVSREYHLDKFLYQLSNNPAKLAKFCFKILCKKISSPTQDKIYLLYNIRGICQIIQSNILPKEWIIEKIKQTLNQPNLPIISKRLLTIALCDTEIYPYLDLHSSKYIDAIKKILHFLESPIYPKTNHLNCAVVFYRDAIPYRKELEGLLVRHKYKKVALHRYQKRIGPITITFQLFATKDANMFKKIINDPSYQIIFTRHHSISGEKFGGKGWPNILPQFIGTKSTGYGLQNNLLALVLAEEIAKGAPDKLSWGTIQERMDKRMDISNFIFPNALIFKLAYASTLFHNPHLPISFPEKVHPVLIVDGGCGGINRIPEYITHYIGPIRRYTNLPIYISRLKQKVKDASIVITTHGMACSTTANIQKELSREEHHQKHKQKVKAGGIEIQTY